MRAFVMMAGGRMAVSKGLKVALCGVAITALSGCYSFTGLTKLELEKSYGPLGPHWLKPVHHIDRVLLLGNVSDPATTEGRLIPTGTGLNNLDRWFTEVGLKQVFVYVKPYSSPTPMNFEPQAGSPAGVYAFTVHPANDSACDEYYRVEKRVEAFYLIHNISYRTIVPKEMCLSYRYVGPLNFDDSTFVELYWMPDAESKRGTVVIVRELRRGETDVVARSVSCGVADGFPYQPPGCPGNADLMTLFSNLGR